MAENTKIEWCHHSWSPWVGCAKVSAGCKHCYAEALTKRSGLAIWGQDGTRRVTSDGYWRKPMQWAKKARDTGERYRIFPSMCDPFEDRPELIEPRARMWHLIGATPELDWLLLTKRPENLMRMVPWTAITPHQPWPNVWLGTSVENQECADERVPHLLATPAAVRFLSCEPLLGPVDLDSENAGIDWVICGGESGHGARPMHPDWARSLRDQCQAAGVAYYFKQWGEWSPIATPRLSAKVEGSSRTLLMHVDGTVKPASWADVMASSGDMWAVQRVGKKAAGRLLDGREWNEFPEASHG